MSFNLSLIEHKIECFEAYNFKELERKIDQQIENNKALLLEPVTIQHQTLYHPELQKIVYTAIIHFKLNKQST